MEADSKPISGVGFGLAKTKSDWWGLAKLSLQFSSQSLVQENVSSWVCFHTFEFPHCLEPPGKIEIARSSSCKNIESKYKSRRDAVFSKYVQLWHQINECCTKQSTCSYFLAWQWKSLYPGLPKMFMPLGRCKSIGQDGADGEKACVMYSLEKCGLALFPKDTHHIPDPCRQASAVSVSGLLTLCWDW